ncbi:MAG: hypothetical protein WAU72_02900 [Acidimicrobiia bacterium]
MSINNVKRLTIHVVLIATIFAILLMALVSAPAYGDNTTSQGYKSDVKLASGTLVSSKANDNTYVEPSGVANRKRILGVVVGTNTSTIAFGGGENSAQIVNGGIVPVLVSDLNGQIKVGDPISVSPIGGTAMLADTKGKIIGTADQNFKDIDIVEKTKVEVTDINGKKKSVNVSLLNVQINIQDWSPTGGVRSNAFLDSTRDFVSNIAGKPVSDVQAFSTLIIAILALLISGIMLYSSVSSSVISIGRNPLSKGIVRRNLLYMLGIITMVIIGASGSIYLILER